MSKKNYLSIVLVLLSVFSLSGCLKMNKGNDFGGVFKSLTKGDEFSQKVLVSSPTQNVVSIGSVNVVSMAMDPQDHSGIYIGTYKNGLYYSYDGAVSWHNAKSLAKRRINSIAVNPDNICNIYATSLNKIFVSKDCNRTYEPLYNDPRSQAVIEKIAISKYNSSVIFAGTSYGDLMKSEDGGVSWVNVGNFKSKITDIAINEDSSLIMASTLRKVYKSTNGGGEWKELTDELKKALKKTSRSNFKKILFYEEDGKEVVMIMSENSIVKTYDKGETWEKLNLITALGKVKLYSMAINPLNGKEIYYGTATSLIKSNDGGQSWVSAELPSTRRPLRLLLDPEYPNILYMGMYRVK